MDKKQTQDGSHVQPRGEKEKEDPSHSKKSVNPSKDDLKSKKVDGFPDKKSDRP